MICDKTRENLEILKNYLLDNYNYVSTHFEMSCYRSTYFIQIKSFLGENFKDFSNCGTHGCLAGWLPFALHSEGKYNLVEDNIYSVDGDLNWVELIKDVLPCVHYDGFISDDCLLWEFLFSDNWSKHDNTLEGAIARIDVVLNNDFEYE